jgi:hypothetical protein
MTGSFVLKSALLGMAALMLGTAAAVAEQAGGPNDGGHKGVYQRRAFESSPMYGDGHDSQRGQGAPMAVNASWFQRPYPYHLDYYRMRYGGSYAPYFGNLYGPPQVVTAPPYYGPYYGGYGFDDPAAGYGYPNGYGPMPALCPCEPNGTSARTDSVEEKSGKAVEQ